MRLSLFRLSLLMVIAVSACTPEAASYECTRTAECDLNLCVGGRCVGSDFGVVVADAAPAWTDLRDAGFPPSKADAVTTPVSGPCVNLVPASAENIVVNEVLVNVPGGADGDANGDGTRDPYDDEFVELANISDDPVEMSGVRILNGDRLKYSFEPLCLLPGESVTVFGGGSVGSSVGGNALVSEVRFSFANDGGSITVAAPTGIIANLEYGSSPPSSLTLAPQLSGAEWVSHLQLSPMPFSPGRCADGAEITTGCSSVEEDIPEEPPDAGADVGADVGIDAGTD